MTIFEFIHVFAEFHSVLFRFDQVWQNRFFSHPIFVFLSALLIYNFPAGCINRNFDMADKKVSITSILKNSILGTTRVQLWIEQPTHWILMLNVLFPPSIVNTSLLLRWKMFFFWIDIMARNHSPVICSYRLPISFSRMSSRKKNYGSVSQK